MSETQHYTLQVETGVIHNDLDMKEIERLKVDRDRLKVELEQAQAKGAEMVGILGICMQALEFHVPYREEGEIAFIGVEGAKRLLEGNPGGLLLDLITSLRGPPAPQDHENCTDCGRAMVWQRTNADDHGSWMCPNCVLERLEKLERVRDAAEEHLLDRRRACPKEEKHAAG